MSRFYDYFLIFYGFFVIINGILFLRGNYFLDENIYKNIVLFSMPAFFFFTGVLFGYLLGYLWILKNDIEDIEFINKVYIKSVAVGSLIGLVMAGIYIYLYNYH